MAQARPRMTMKAMRALLKEYGIPGYSTMTRAELEQEVDEIFEMEGLRAHGIPTSPLSSRRSRSRSPSVISVSSGSSGSRSPSASRYTPSESEAAAEPASPRVSRPRAAKRPRMTLKEMRELCKRYGIKGTSKMSRFQLEGLVRGIQQGEAEFWESPPRSSPPPTPPRPKKRTRSKGRKRKTPTPPKPKRRKTTKKKRKPTPKRKRTPPKRKRTPPKRYSPPRRQRRTPPKARTPPGRKRRTPPKPRTPPKRKSPPKRRSPPKARTPPPARRATPPQRRMQNEVAADVKRRTQGKSLYLLLNELLMQPGLLNADSPWAAVKKAYHRVVLKIHPDKNRSGSPKTRMRSQELFKVVNELFLEQQARQG